MTENERALLDDLLADDSDRLSAWEVEFIESLDKRRQYPLSLKQEMALHMIARKLDLEA